MSEEEFVDAIVNLNEEKALVVIEDLLKTRTNIEILNIIRQGMERVGEKFSVKEYYLAELVYSAEIFKKIIKKLNPRLVKNDKKSSLGKIIFGTAKNDIHDLGKNIIISLLRANGYEVIDLGVDVSAEQFIDAIKKEKPQVLE